MTFNTYRQYPHARHVSSYNVCLFLMQYYVFFMKKCLRFIEMCGLYGVRMQYHHIAVA